MGSLFKLVEPGGSVSTPAFEVVDTGGVTTIKIDGTSINPTLTEATTTAANTITAVENGKTFFMTATGAATQTLPTAAAGLRYSFINTTTAQVALTLSSGSANIKGRVYPREITASSSGSLVTSGANTITFVASKTNAGDRVDVICDGTDWWADCFPAVADGITITTA